MKKVILFCGLIISLVVLLTAYSLSRAGNQHREYLAFVEGLREQNIDSNCARVILSSSGESGGARVVIIEDESILKKFFQVFHQAPTVLVADYRLDDGSMLPNGSYFETFTMSIRGGKTSLQGRFYIGGHQDVGIGFLIERSQDNDWFHGAWDPWPREAYWFKTLNPEWINAAGSGLMVSPDDQWKYEAFLFLFFLKKTAGGVELHFANGEWNYRLVGTRSDREKEVLSDLVELNSIREFFRRHPELMRTIVHSDRVSLPSQ